MERWQPEALLDSNPVSLFGLLVPLFTKGPSQCSSDLEVFALRWLKLERGQDHPRLVSNI